MTTIIGNLCYTSELIFQRSIAIIITFHRKYYREQNRDFLSLLLSQTENVSFFVFIFHHVPFFHLPLNFGLINYPIYLYIEREAMALIKFLQSNIVIWERGKYCP